VRAIIITYVLSNLFILIGFEVQAQAKKDSVEKKSLTKKAFREGVKLISTNPADTIVNEKSIDPYSEYAGKIIRNINIERIGFEKSIYDSAKKVTKTVTRLANTLHVDTREKIIRKHLFINKNKPLNPHEMADNERFLRDKDFILDSRIVVVPVEGTDSVDLTVITRDIFSLGGSMGGTFPTSPKIGVYDANVDGRGQRIEFNALIDQDRTPKFGYSLLYRKSSIFGSLTNFELRYTELNNGYSFGDENEFAILMKLDRPLVSPYSRLAGGAEVSRNWSENVFAKTDSIFLKYNYKVVDGWIGYNIGINKEISNRDRKFIAMRFVDGYYIDQPDQLEYQEIRKYNNIYGYLSEFTFYQQNFYKTRYVFGFGRTEDVPYGYTFGITAGYVRQLGIERPYGAFKWNYGVAFKKGDFIRLQAQLGGYVRNNKMEDVIMQTGATWFTRLYQLNRFKLRNVAGATYTQLSNRTAIDYIKIGRNEIPGFSGDSLNTDQRLALHVESVLFTPWSLLGFRLAPFAALDMVSVNCIICATDNELYYGISSGLRTRNENLIFGTIEMKATYIPKDQYGNSKFVFSFKQNLKVKNTGSFVKAPALILYN
jgi:hypothetical protein